MVQYRVEYKAYDYPEIARGITAQEFLESMEREQRQSLRSRLEWIPRAKNFMKSGIFSCKLRRKPAKNAELFAAFI